MADKLQEDTLAGANDSEPQANNNFNQEDSESRYSEEKKTDIASIWKDKYLPGKTNIFLERQISSFTC